MSSSENVMVVCRCRPFSEKEKNAGHSQISEIDLKSKTVRLKDPNQAKDVKQFTFDQVFDTDSTQQDVYETTAINIVDAVLGGFNGTVFVYGQTGTGKTHTMQGVLGSTEQRGVIPNSFNHIFDYVEKAIHKKFLVRISFLEIYNEEIKDLLIKPSSNVKGGLELKEHNETGVYVKDLSIFVVKSVAEMQRFVAVGNKNRSVAATLMNETSSRSHSIITIIIESSELGNDGQEHYKSGQLNLVDLAGSERQSKTGATGDRLKEATKINLSLSALGNCISSLVDGKSTHIPYRDSKLTRLLQSSLGGNAKTLMIATFSPASYNYEETISTLRYANRAKSIKNQPVINEDPKDAMLRQFQEEIKRLKESLKIQKLRGYPKPLTKSGEHSEAEDSDDGNPLSIIDADTISQLQSVIKSEKQKLIASKDMVIEEKNKISAELDKRAADVESEKLQREILSRKLIELEDKLLIGGVHILVKVSEQELLLKSTQNTLQDQQKKQRELQSKIDDRQNAKLQLEVNCSSLQDEVELKTKNLSKVWNMYQASKDEVTSAKDDLREEREELLETIRDLTKEILLIQTITKSFIPSNEREQLERRIVFDESPGDSISAKMTFPQEERMDRVCLIPTLKRPLCHYAKQSMVSGNPRYRYDNVINVPLIIPLRRTMANEVSTCPDTHISVYQGLPIEPRSIMPARSSPRKKADRIDELIYPSSRADKAPNRY